MPDVDAEIYVWEGTLTDGTIAPYEGANVLSWQTTGKGWFGAGIMSRQPLNLFDFPDGHLKFRIRIPANVTFKIGIIDAWGNQSYVSFPAYQTTYGLVRDGQWGQAAIPVIDIRGTAMDLRMLSYAFVILEENGTACEFALDDIYWDAGAVSGVDDGVAAARAAARDHGAQPVQRAHGDPLLPGGGRALRPGDLQPGRAARGGPARRRGRPASTWCRWDGRDAAGAVVASGVYSCRVRQRGGRGRRFDGPGEVAGPGRRPKNGHGNSVNLLGLSRNHAAMDRAGDPCARRRSRAANGNRPRSP